MNQIRLFRSIAILLATVAKLSHVECKKKDGSCIKGSCVNSIGTWMWPTHDVYTGQFNKAGYRHGAGIFRWNKTQDVYEGSFKNGLPDGAGVYVWGTNAQRYVGQFSLGRKHGLGVFRAVDFGEIYEGQFENGLFSGLGRLTFDNGTLVEGEFKFGRVFGLGIRKDIIPDTLDGTDEPNTAIAKFYRGEFYRGQRNGYGVTTAGKSTHSGIFMRGVPMNLAVYETDDGGSSYAGTYAKGYGGHGVVTFDVREIEKLNIKQRQKRMFGSRHTYYGETMDGQSHGLGRWEYANGEVYIGATRNGKRHGMGVLMSVAGDKIAGNWSNDGIILGTKSGPTQYMGSFAGKFDNSGMFVFGRIVTTDGNVYDGECKQGPSGIGVATSIDGTKYMGEFRDGRRSGYGVYSQPHFVDKLGNTFEPAKQNTSSIEKAVNVREVPEYIGLWYKNKFVVSDEHEDDVQIAWDFSFQAKQTKALVKLTVDRALEASRYARYVVAKKAVKHIDRAKSMAYHAHDSRTKAKKMANDAEIQIIMVNETVKEAQIVESMLETASQFLKKKQHDTELIQKKKRKRIRREQRKKKREHDMLSELLAKDKERDRSNLAKPKQKTISSSLKPRRGAKTVGGLSIDMGENRAVAKVGEEMAKTRRMKKKGILRSNKGPFIIDDDRW